MALSIFAWQWNDAWLGLLLVFVLFGLLLGPFLLKEIRDGKRDLGPLRRRTRDNRVVLGPPTPPGAGDNQPGSVSNPAPGMPDGKADPYSSNARRAS